MTRILAIETSLRNGSVALAQDGVIVGSRGLPADSRSAQSLAPVVKELLAEMNWKPGELDVVGLTVGPGSFTGLRVGVTFAKVFCYAAGIPLIGLTTLEVIANQVPDASGEIHVLLDAQRTDLFQQAFKAEGGALKPLNAPRVIDIQEWITEIANSNDILVTGPGVKKIQGLLTGSHKIADESAWEPIANTVLRLTWDAFQAGRRDDVWKLAPLYLRASAAEEKRSTT